MANLSLYPTTDKEMLKEKFVGKSLKDIDAPAAVLDLNKVTRNCRLMLEAVSKLGFGWRAHIKTHKTTELTSLQVGDSGTVNIIVSTILEAENILPFLLECKENGRAVNILYGIPVALSSVARLSKLNTALGPGGVSLMIDHTSQLSAAKDIYKESSISPLIFIKIDMGYHRAGVEPQTESCAQLISLALSLEAEGIVNFHGLYAHAGHSYSSSNPATALSYLRQELESLLATAQAVQAAASGKKLILSVGATPTSTSIRNLLTAQDDSVSEQGREISALRGTIEAIRNEDCSIEIHAGVYPVLDLQQLSTHALPSTGPDTILSWSDLALTVMAEVVSIYPGRGINGTAEVLVGAGSLALGREPCKAYPGWGILSTWNRTGLGASLPTGSVEDYKGWQVGKVSQEHGILTYSDLEAERLEIGQKVRIWPNHACVAGAGFGWYLIVDGSKKGKEDEIINVWPRWRGW